MAFLPTRAQPRPAAGGWGRRAESRLLGEMRTIISYLASESWPYSSPASWLPIQAGGSPTRCTLVALALALGAASLRRHPACRSKTDEVRALNAVRSDPPAHGRA
jgi:hypothetical protein